jgi:tetratricopeptide (TPR) repeat protein
MSYISRQMPSYCNTLFVFLIFLLYLFTPIKGTCAQSSMQEKAFSLYTKGVEDQTPEQRKKDFNNSLELYLDLASQYPSGSLYYNIGNCYFQVGEYGLAIFYYYKAKVLLPRSDLVQTNLSIALSKVGIPLPLSSFVDDYLLCFYTKLSAYEKGLWAIGAFMLTFIFFSFYIWFSLQAFRKCGLITLTIALLLYGSLLWQQFFVLPEAIVIRTSLLYRGPGMQYMTLPQPCLAGTKAQVLEVADDGNWLRLQTKERGEGYISKENARLL